ncbi:sterol desaturase family protein [Streptomyces ipomoeae]|uniref:sterol desaturase family protein n=1 Tax=Streptomyces ipomoeae TaxID=103232 RepID=UPI0011478E32|nr:sterol desaturase family protein [Streptomyces ipomoeae]MDX2937481.1 sterol desaturase family protein [Streptomyces ipomoeae]TQE17331.1 fatty acid hydroxylase family protein [Streptomyces ipomoeae]
MRGQLRILLRHAAYPALMATLVAVAIAALRLHWDLGRVSQLFLVGTIAYMALLEWLIPYEPEWAPSAREWGWYGVYFVLTMIGGALSQVPVAAVVRWAAPPHPTLPLWAELPLALLLGSLANYLVHRWCHTDPRLWRLHGVHHVPDKVNVGNNGVNHLLDIVLTQGVVQCSLALAGFSTEAVFVMGLFVVSQGYFVHANIDVRIGVLNHVLAGPEQHRLHHSVDLSEAGHYGSDLSIWDHAFGSFTWRPGRRPVAVGLRNPADFPRTDEVVASHLQAWRRPTRADDSPTGSAGVSRPTQ